MSYLVLDLEIERSPVAEPGGWELARQGRLGVSCACTFHSETGQFYLFDRHNLRDILDQLRGVDTVVTFNGNEFDLPCLEGRLGEPLKVNSSYDILQEIWAALATRRKGFKLNDVCKRTLGLEKSGQGVYATELYAQGRYGELFTYCMHDVYLTQILFEHIMDHQYIIDPSGERLILGEPNGRTDAE